jgi:hypothetical protein
MSFFVFISPQYADTEGVIIFLKKQKIIWSFQHSYCLEKGVVILQFANNSLFLQSNGL